MPRTSRVFLAARVFRRSSRFSLGPRGASARPRQTAREGRLSKGPELPPGSLTPNH